MTTLREAAQQALEALVSQFDGRADAIDILSAALAEQDEAAVYVPTVVSWSGGPMPFATIRVRLDETPTEYEYVPAHNTAEQAQPVPPGWRMVPVEPTDAMVLAGIHAIYAASGEFEPVPSEIDALFEAMLAAAPEAPSPLVPQPLTIEKLRDALVASRVIDSDAVEDPDNYDDGVMLHRIEALFRRIA